MAAEGVSDTERGTDETFDFLCSICQVKNTNKEAEKFCSDCNDYYCSTCVKFHANIPALKNHYIIDSAQFQLGSSEKSLPVPIGRCKLHKHKPVNIFVKTHEVVACAACMLDEISICKDEFDKPGFITKNRYMPNSTDVAEQLDAIANLLSVLKKTLITEKEKLKRSKENALKQIESFRKEINQRLDELESSTIDELDRRFQSLQDKIESELKELQNEATEVMDAHDNLKSTTGNTAQAFVSVKTGNTIATLAKFKSDKIISQLSSPEISFVANQELNFLHNDIQVLGEITVTEKPILMPPHHNSLHKVKNSQNIQKTYERQSMSSLLEIKGCKEYNVQVKSDRLTSNIMSACTLEDGTIILTDCRNAKLKRVNPTTFVVTDYCDVSAGPLQVCAISNTEVAVCFSNSPFIQLVTIERTMQKTRQIKTGVWCQGLAYAAEKLFVSEHTSLNVFSLSGERLQKFGLGEMFGSSLAVSRDNSVIYITCPNKGLIIIDQNGSPIGGFNGPELNDAYNVCLNNSGDVLVCGYTSSNILQFSPDGNLIGELVKTDNKCQTICCNNTNSKLIVGFERNNSISVYDISG